MRQSYLFLHIAVILAGFTGILGKLIQLNEGLLTWYRILISSLALFIILLITKTPHPKDDKLRMAGTGCIIMIHWLFFMEVLSIQTYPLGWFAML